MRNPAPTPAPGDGTEGRTGPLPRRRRVRRVRVDLRELYGLAPDDLVEEVRRQIESLLSAAQTGNTLRESFDPVRANVGGTRPNIMMLAGRVGRGTPMDALLDFAGGDADMCIAAVAARRRTGHPRRAAIVFVEHQVGFALELTIPFTVTPGGRTRYRPAGVRTCPRRIWP